MTRSRPCNLFALRVADHMLIPHCPRTHACTPQLSVSPVRTHILLHANVRCLVPVCSSGRATRITQYTKRLTHIRTRVSLSLSLCKLSRRGLIDLTCTTRSAQKARKRLRKVAQEAGSGGGIASGVRCGRKLPVSFLGE